MARSVSISSSPIAGVPASISGTPASASASAIATFSSGRESDARRLFAVAQRRVVEPDAPDVRLTARLTHRRTPRMGRFAIRRRPTTVAQSRHDLERRGQRAVDIVVVGLARQGKAHRAELRRHRNVHRLEHVRRRVRARRAGGAGRDRDPSRASIVARASASTPAQTIALVFGRRSALAPSTTASGIRPRRPLSSRSRGRACARRRPAGAARRSRPPCRSRRCPGRSRCRRDERAPACRRRSAARA